MSDPAYFDKKIGVPGQTVLVLPMEPWGKRAPKPKAIKLPGGKVRGGTYDNPKNAEPTAVAQTHIRSQLMGLGVDEIRYPQGPLIANLYAVFTMPRSRHLKASVRPRELHFKKPDEDNIRKWIKDAGTGLLWTDDAQVVGGETYKITGHQGERPRVILQVIPADAETLRRVGDQIRQLERTL